MEDKKAFLTSGDYFAIGNCMGILEVQFLLCIQKPIVRNIYCLSVATVKCLIISFYHKFNWEVSFYLQLATIMMLGFLTYYEKLEQKNIKTIYETYMQVKNYESLVTNYLPVNLVIMDFDMKNIIYKNSCFTEKFNTEKSMELEKCLGKFRIDSAACSPKFAGKKLIACLEELSALMNNEFSTSTVLSAHITQQKDIQIGTQEFDQKTYYQIIVRRIQWDLKPSYAFIINDLTDREMISALTLADQQKDQVIATVSHELRTPINGILGLLNMSLEKATDEEQIDYLNHCKSCSKLLLYLVNSILDLSQLRHNKLKILKDSFSLDEMLEELKALYTFQAEQKGLEFRISKGEALPRKIYSDKYRIIEILINLIGNALKFTFSGYIELRVELDLEDSDFIILKVKDTGLGIKDEDKDKLFKMFGKLEQSDKKVNKHGAGLGLTISDQLVRAFNAETDQMGIYVESTYGKGTTFWFRLPYKKPQLDITFDSLLEEDSIDLKEFMGDRKNAAKAKTFVHNKISPAQHLRSSFLRVSARTTLTSAPLLSYTPGREKLFPNKGQSEQKVLVVDDNAFNHMAAAHLLKRFGIQAIKALNGYQCLNILKSKEHNFDLILMDIQMPGMDGYETSAKIQEMIKKKEIKNIPIVALTAETEIKSKQAFFQAGMVSCLEKPLDEASVKKVIETFCKGNNTAKNIM